MTVSRARSDPWRYKCDKCGSHSLSPRRIDGLRVYHCQGCEDTVSTVYDKKKEKVVLTDVQVSTGSTGGRK